MDTFGEILNFLFRREESMDSRFNFDYDVKLRIHRNHHSYCGKKYKSDYTNIHSTYLATTRISIESPRRELPLKFPPPVNKRMRHDR